MQRRLSSRGSKGRTSASKGGAWNTHRKELATLGIGSVAGPANLLIPSAASSFRYVLDALPFNTSVPPVDHLQEHVSGIKGRHGRSLLDISSSKDPYYVFKRAFLHIMIGYGLRPFVRLASWP